jgi:pyruvate/2-oxoglutarate dehydrogenase complex dihydrolipoamide dehydrogenase (E3) component
MAPTSSTRRTFDVFVIGGGGTGSEVAFRLAEQGLKVGVAERDRLGGVCNHAGCVPTKAMLRSAKMAAMARSAEPFGVRIPTVEVDLTEVRRRVRSVIDAQSGSGADPFEAAGITVLMDEARLVGPNELELASGERIHADRIVLALGSVPEIPPITGLEGSPFWTSRAAIWEPAEVPGSLAIVGAGAIGIEFAQIYARFGSRVTVLEAAPQLLPGEDEDVPWALRPALRADGIELRTGVEVRRVDHADGTFRLAIGGARDLEVDELLVATGRRVDLDGHDLDAAGVERDDRGELVLDETLRTTSPHIWAAGDATGELMFTHVGDYEADIVAEDILGRPQRRDYRVVPRVTFTDPEVASVGLTEDAARRSGADVTTSVVRIADNERARIDGVPYGIVKLIQDTSSRELLGGHIVADGAGSMIHEIVAAMSGRLPASRLEDSIHAYPTLASSVRDAAAALDGS